MSNAFSGNPKAEWLSDEASRNMRLLEDFYYVDPNGRHWPAPRGSIVDGASIPAPLWSTVGSPYTGKYRNASVVHDVACADESIDRAEADQMFYFACIAGGCSVVQARLLYAGVRIGAWAPKMRLWTSESVQIARVQQDHDLVLPTVTSRSVLTTFEEISVDINALSEDTPFSVVRDLVERHLSTKSAQ